MKKLSTSNLIGFTLIELLIAITILTISVAISAPTFNKMIKNFRLTNTYNEAVVNLTSARSEAAKRGVQVTVCASGNLDAEDPSCSNNLADWHKGYLIFAKVDTTNSADTYTKTALTATSDVILRRVTASSRGIKFTPDRAFFQYNTDGTTNTETRILMCDNRGKAYALALIIRLSGRPEIDKTVTGDEYSLVHSYCPDPS